MFEGLLCLAYGWTTVKQKIRKLKVTKNKVVVEISADLQYSHSYKANKHPGA